VACWGSNSLGQLGAGSSTTVGLEPVVVSSLVGVSQIALGGSHSCALTKDGQVHCWGDNNNGQAGSGTAGPGQEVSRPSPVVGLSHVTAIGVGGDNSCALTSQGKVFCWGGNGAGQLNNSEFTAEYSVKPIKTTLVGARAVHLFGDASYGGGCMLSLAGTVTCFGGTSSTGGCSPTMPCPDQQTPLKKIVALSLGGYNCALSNTGKVSCFNFGPDGLPIDGIVPVANLLGVTDLAAGGGFACAAMGDGTVQCWGRNDVMQLGFNGPASNGPKRVQAGGLL
jgi:alpha-tubulin suppressor-like RCC1 family protein